MNINTSIPFRPQFKNKLNEEESSIIRAKEKETFLDKFETSIRNSADMNDTIQVPRTIFKGYLAFMAGTALMTVASIIKNNFPKTSNILNTMNAALIIYGTYSFVRPYIIKNKK